jgi:hypothetical protein
LSNVPAGEYLVTAVADFEPGSQYDPEILGSLIAGAESITVTGGARVTKNVAAKP